MKPIFVINGPNLNRLGTREPGVYGSATLADIKALLERDAARSSLSIRFVQSNHEGALIDAIHEAADQGSAILINAGAFTHTSIAIHDALRTVSLPIVEVHLSNVFARESFRHHSYISSVARGVICGFGAASYSLALAAVLPLLQADRAGDAGAVTHA
jgi:3-dehydroquinate dehydratase-2